jgi:hypothetical protein
MKQDGEFRTTGDYYTKNAPYSSSLRSAERDGDGADAQAMAAAVGPRGQSRRSQGGSGSSYSEQASPAQTMSSLRAPTANKSGGRNMRRTVDDDLQRYMVERALRVAHEDASQRQVPTRAQQAVDQRSQTAAALLGRGAPAPRQQQAAPQRSILKALLARKANESVY